MAGIHEDIEEHNHSAITLLVLQPETGHDIH